MMTEISDVEEIEQRLKRAEVTGSPEAVNDPGTVALAALAMARRWPQVEEQGTNPGDGLVRLVLATARLHQLRTRPGDGEDPDRMAAALLHALARRWRPRAVPGSLVSELPAGTLIAAAEAAWDQHAWAVFASWEDSGDFRVLDAVIELRRAMVRAAPGTGSAQAICRAKLALALRARLASGGHEGDFDEGTTALRQAVSMAAGTVSLRVRLLSDLGAMLMERFEKRAEAVELDEGIAALRAARTLATSAGQVPAGVTSNLACALHRRYEITASPADLREALALAEAAVAGTPAGDPDRPMYMANLASTYLALMESDDPLGDADHAVDAALAALTSTSREDPHFAGRLLNLVQALNARYERTADPGDIDTALSFAQEACEHARPGTAAWASHRNSLAAALLARYQHAGGPDDLNRAIKVEQESLNATAPDDPGLADRRSLLGLMLRMRYERSWSLADLDAAIEVGLAAVTITPAGHALRPGRLSNVGYTLALRFERTGEAANLEQALRLTSEAIRATPPGHPDLAKALSNLARGHSQRYNQARNPADLDAAVAFLDRAVDATPAAHPDLAMFLSNRANLLVDRFEAKRDQADLAAAIRDARGAVEAASALGSEDSTFTLNLGLALLRQFRSNQDRQVGAQAVAMFRRTAQSEVATSRTRTVAAHEWARTAALLGEWAHAVVAYERALTHLQAWTWGSAERGDTVDALTELGGIANDAAAAALEAGDVGQAIRLLEYGRGILHSHALRLHEDRDRLLATAPALAARMDGIRKLLDQAPVQVGAWQPPAAGHSLISTEDRYRLAQEWEELLDWARELPGLSDLMRAPAATDQQAVPGTGVVVIVNISRHRCDAILVTSDQPRVLPLRGLTAASVRDHASALLTALQDATQSQWHMLQAPRTVAGTLAWIWDSIAEPVANELGLKIEPSSADLPRLWWCPTGPAQFLPIHAAGHQDMSMIDLAICSYTPTLRALRVARGKPVPHHDSPILAVAIPDAEGLAPLPQAQAEVIAVTRHFSHSARLEGPQATRENILSEIGRHAFFHFAGHGGQDPHDITSGALYPHDHLENGPIRLASLAGLRLQNAELAFLSACETARGVTRLADEAVHIAGALQIAGFTHVMATQWVVYDRQARRIAADFYQNLARIQQAAPRPNDPAGIATALQQAVRNLRDRAPANPIVWAQYIHIGP